MKQSIIYLILFSFFLSLGTSALAQSGGEAAEAPAVTSSDSKAKVVIYRDKQFAGSALNFAIYINDVKLCKLSNNRYIEWEVDPGEVVINAKRGGIEAFKKKTEIKLDTESGGVYFIRCDLKSSLMRTRMELSEVTENTAERDMEEMQRDDCQENMDENYQRRKN